MYASFFSELRKIAAQPLREVATSWSRKGKWPIRSEKLLEKGKDGGVGWKPQSGRRSTETGWIPSKEDSRGEPSPPTLGPPRVDWPHTLLTVGRP